MTLESEEAVVPMRPGLLKAIGILNLVFGTLLFVYGVKCLGDFAPSLIHFQPISLEASEAQQFYEYFQSDVVRNLELREQDATSEADKAQLQSTRHKLEKDRADISRQFDWKQLNADLLWMSWYLWANVLTAPFLNLFMVASGLGLIQLQCWARTMGIWVAGLKIARLVILTAVLLVLIIPRMARTFEAGISSDLVKSFVQFASVTREASNTIRFEPPVAGSASPSAGYWRLVLSFLALFGLFLSLVYPVTMLLVLTRPSARSACVSLPEKEPEA